MSQMDEPWSRLHDAATLASFRQSVIHYEHQVTYRVTQDCDHNLLNQKISQRKYFEMHPSFLNLRLQTTASTSN